MGNKQNKEAPKEDKMTAEKALQIWSFYIDSILIDERRDDSRMDMVSHKTIQLEKAWNYIRENLK